MASDRTVRIRRWFDAESLWTEVVRPWILAHRVPDPGAGQACVIVPTAGASALFRARLAREGISHFGIRFASHTDYWNTLKAGLDIGATVATREDLHLMLAAAAAASAVQTPAVQSVARDPSALMSAVDHMAAAGWDTGQLEPEELAPVLGALFEAVSDSSMLTAQAVDRLMFSRAADFSPICSAMLIAGFGGRHWPLWFALRAAARSSRDTTVCLQEPRLAGGLADEIWVSSWEDAGRESEAVAPSASASPFAGLTEAIIGGSRFDGAGVDFRIARNPSDEARAIVAQTMAYLASAAGATRIGILFPGPDSAARQTAALLAGAGIEFNDSLGARFHGPAQERWQAWLAFQAQPDARRLAAMLDRAPELGEVAAGGTARLRSQVMNAAARLGVADLDVVGSEIGTDLGAMFRVLPVESSFGDYAERAESWFTAFPTLGGPDSRDRIRTARLSMGARWTAPIQRGVFAGWLVSATVRPARTRYAEGSHPFAAVNLLSYNDADFSSFSHLILTGLNRHRWPQDFRPEPFLPADRMTRFNGCAIREGSQGAGHRVAAPGRGIMLTPAERSSLAHQQFFSLLECASDGLCFTAAMTLEDDPSRTAPPGDLLVRAWAAVSGEGLSDAQLSLLADRTGVWLRNSVRLRLGLPAAAASSSTFPPCEAVSEAYNARRDETRPFGIYEFGLTPGRPRPPVILSCTAWENAAKIPELAWLRSYLGVAPEEDPFLDVRAARMLGTWTHQLLAESLAPAEDPGGGPGRMPDRALVFRRLKTACHRIMRETSLSFGNTSRKPPFWWHRLHEQAAAAADAMARHVADAVEAGWVLGRTEWNLPANATARFADTALPVRGRVDLALFKERGGECMVVDFKTGSPPSLTPADIADGAGIQILLYALSLGHAKAGMSVMNPAAEPVFRIAADLAGQERVGLLLQDFRRMHETGVFGALGDPRMEFGRNPDYPLAHLRVNPDILAAKRDLTFRST